MKSRSEHPLRSLLTKQGRTLTWLAGRLECNRATLAGRLSGRRAGAGKRGPKPWTPVPVLVTQVAHELQIPRETLAGWLAPQE